MAPSWSNIFPSGSRTSNNKSTPSRNDTARDKDLPALPVHRDELHQIAPSGSSPLHNHTRSASQPIPRIFSRKKSTNDLRSDAPNATHVPSPDDATNRAFPSSAKAVGKRKGSDGVDTKVTRRCICCDSKVKIPQEMDKFRCMLCLTINDLKPVARLPQESPQNVPVHPPALQLTVERTKAIIERCLVSYLESRSRRQHGRGASVATNGIEAGQSQTIGDIDRICASPVAASSEGFPNSGRGLNDRSPGSFTVSPRIDSSTSPVQQRSLPRKPVQVQPSRAPPRPELQQRTSSQDLDVKSTALPRRDASLRASPSPQLTAEELSVRQRYDRIKTIFRPLDDYIVATYGNLSTLNTSFSSVRPVPIARARSESHITTPPPESTVSPTIGTSTGLDELDAKMLLLGDIGENGSWWTGKFDRRPSDKIPRKKVGSESRKPVSSKSPNINWAQLGAWYDIVQGAGLDWRRLLEILQESPLRMTEGTQQDIELAEIEQDLTEAREHTVRTLLKVTENVLKRPGKPLKEPEHLRFLFIMLANPSLQLESSAWPPRTHVHSAAKPSPSRKASLSSALQHTGLLKRIFGLLANTPDACHRYIVGWLSRLDEEHFIAYVDLCTAFIGYRLSRKSRRPHNNFVDGGLIPDFSGGAMSTSAQLHSAMGLSGSVKKRSDDPGNEPEWANDWQVKSAAKVMSLLFSANSIWQGRRKDDSTTRATSGKPDETARLKDKSQHARQLLPTSSFYNTLLDYHDVIADFKIWEGKKDKFAFCQYPFLLSMAAKTKVLEFDARRQMEIKAREAIFDQVINQRATDGQLTLKVRRECLAEDSLRQISEAVGAGQEELKKGLRVQFANEEGVDAGGLRKEWFLMLAREVFDAEHGLFIYDEQSRTCYFNPHTFETSDQFFLVGALLGLAIYNSIILDIALPSFAFRKLLAAAPPGSTQLPVVSRPQMTYTLADLAEYRPSLAAGLQQLLDYDGDVETTYCWSFVAPVDRYGALTEVPLIPGGEIKAVTNDNRIEFVDAYVKYLLDTAVTRQFEPFKRGFFTVCAGNALTLFKADEIELLIRGSDDTLDVMSLKAVAAHENWRHEFGPHAAVHDPASSVPVLQWFWEAFEAAPPEMQRRLLAFITSSDRIPAVGATSLVLRIVAGGDGWSGKDSQGRPEQARYPIARTCFNMLVLWKYESREQLEQRLWRAVSDSEGFGLK